MNGRKNVTLVAIALLLGLLTSCTEGASENSVEPSAEAMSWQEQYDLGVRYLSEGNYAEAIIAFTTAIEIDPKQPGAYLGLANAYIETGNKDAAREILEVGVAAVDDPAELEELLQTLESAGLAEVSPSEEDHTEEREYNEDGTLKRQNYFDADGKLESYRLYVDSGDPGVKRIDNYTADGIFTGYTLYYKSEDGLSSYSEGFDAEGNSTGKSVRVSDESGKWLYSAGLNEDGSEWSRNEAIYDANGENIGWDTYRDGELVSYARYENGTTVYYNADGSVKGSGGVE